MRLEGQRDGLIGSSGLGEGGRVIIDWEVLHLAILGRSSCFCNLGAYGVEEFVRGPTITINS